MTAARVSVWTDGLVHSNGLIPNASSIDPLVWTGGISGAIPGTKQLPLSIEDEVAQMFRNVGATLHGAGVSFQDVIRLTIFSPERAVILGALDLQWVKAFPDSESRPTRHVLAQELPAGMRIQCEAIAVKQRRWTGPQYQEADRG